MNSNLTKWIALITYKKGYTAEAYNSILGIPQTSELTILGLTFQPNCKFSNHLKERLCKANKCFCYIARLSLNKMSTVTGCSLVTCPWSNLHVSRPGYNCAVVARTPSLFVCFCCMIVWSLGKLVSFVFPRVLMFLLYDCMVPRETS